MSEFILKNECDQRSSQFMEELKETKLDVKEMKGQLHKIDLRLVELPGALATMFDSRYAQKRVEEDLENLEKKQELFERETNKKTYEWLKWVVGITVGLVIGITGSVKF